jgi:hypothetical protein
MSAHFEHTIAITTKDLGSLDPSRTRSASERSHEGTSIRQTDLSQVQGHQAQGRRSHHLQQPSPQAASGLRGKSWHASQASTSRATSAIEIALTYIYGLGRHAANVVLKGGHLADKKTMISTRTTSARSATIEANFRVEGDLRRDTS